MALPDWRPVASRRANLVSRQSCSRVAGGVGFGMASVRHKPERVLSMMFQTSLRFGSSETSVSYPAALRPEFTALIGAGDRLTGPPASGIRIAADGANHFVLTCDRIPEFRERLARADVLRFTLDLIVPDLIDGLDDRVAIHAASVAYDGKAVLIAGKSGAGKSTLAAWLVECGCAYLSDEAAALAADNRIEGLRRPLIVKPDVVDLALGLNWIAASYRVAESGNLIVAPPPADVRAEPAPCGLVIVPEFSREAPARLKLLSAARAATLLMSCNLNARNLDDHGLDSILTLVRSAPVVQFRYSRQAEIEAVAQKLVAGLCPQTLEPMAAEDFLGALNAVLEALPPAGTALPANDPVKSAPMATPSYPAATPKRTEPVKLTIGMATYDDYDGVYFSIQALRLQHADCLVDAEIVVVDNNPGGSAAQPLKNLEHYVPNYRYVPVADRSGTAVREQVFQEAAGRLVLCMDCHVLLMPGALKALIDYFDANPHTDDLLQGPLVYDDLRTRSSHWVPVWGEGMLGQWRNDERADDPNGEPFEIPMQGLGLFAARRESWLGFNPAFRGFGGEEGYLHEKYRKAGRKTLCIPALGWVHRFERPMGVNYANRWEDRIFNYLCGFHELGMPSWEMEEHFVSFLGQETALPLLASARRMLFENIGAK
ncbi:glycosyltransferase [bacterium]|nr:glycosyltransferase [bacterium]